MSQRHNMVVVYITNNMTGEVTRRSQKVLQEHVRSFVEQILERPAESTSLERRNGTQVAIFKRGTMRVEVWRKHHRFVP